MAWQREKARQEVIIPFLILTASEKVQLKKENLMVQLEF